MKKIKGNTTFFAIILLVIWIVITISLFFVDTVLFILSLLFFVLFYIYLSKLSIIFDDDRQQIKMLSNMLETTLDRMEYTQAKEKLLRKKRSIE